MSNEDKDIRLLMDARKQPVVQVVAPLPSVGAFVRTEALEEMEHFAEVGKKVTKARPWLLAGAAANLVGWLWVAGAITPWTVTAAVLFGMAGIIGINNGRWW